VPQHCRLHDLKSGARSMKHFFSVTSFAF
jgi:hypothetical protein